jgi:hypothetical protein
MKVSGFCCDAIDALCEYIMCVKPQLAVKALCRAQTETAATTDYCR